MVPETSSLDKASGSKRKYLNLFSADRLMSDK